MYGMFLTILEIPAFNTLVAKESPYTLSKLCVKLRAILPIGFPLNIMWTVYSTWVLHRIL
jgi:hypothetical protein